MSNTSGFKKLWYKNWFGPEYAEVYAHRNETDAQHLMGLVFQNIEITRSMRILDAACGNGRHASIIAQKSDYVFGIDLSLFLLKQARQNGRFKMVRGDLRQLPFKQYFDLILNLFTSFGYFFEEQENFAVLREFYHVLQMGGYLFIDVMNDSYIRKHLQKHSVKRINSKKIIEQRRLVDKRVEKDIIIEDQKGQKKFHESVRLYTETELIELLEKAGFSIIKKFGDYFGRKLSPQSPRLILLAQKR